MIGRNTIFFIDSDNDYRQELISRFATSIEDFKLCGVKNLDEMEILIGKGFLKKNKNFLVISDQQFNSNGHSLLNIVTTYSKPKSVLKIIVYSSNNEEIKHKSKELSKFKKLKIIERNDFGFYRIQNIIRNSVNRSDYKRELVGFVVSFLIFTILVTWYCLI